MLGILSSIEYGGYISIAKLVPFVMLFYISLMLINWMYIDTKSVKTKTYYWLGMITGTISLAAILWLVIPVYLVGILLFITMVGGLSLFYVMHRNSLVADFERILTPEHIKGIFSNADKKVAEAGKGFSFVTANGNEVDAPEAKTKEAYGFKTACSLFDDAIWRRTSDIYFMPAKEDYSVSYVIDGVKSPQDSMEIEEIDYFIYYLKQLADLNVDEKRKPQLGIFKTKRNGKTVEWEVRTAGSTAGEQIHIRQAQEAISADIDSIGLQPEQIEQIQKLKSRKNGLFLIGGPSGSGVTTLQYALLKNHDPYMNTIVTLEKKIAGELEGITQTPFTLSDTGTSTFDRKLTTMLRMGPEIVGVGDLEEKAAAEVASKFSDSRLLYVSLEASSCLQTLSKWLSMVPDRQLALENLVGIATPRLFRVLCDECKEAYQPNPETLKKMNIPANKANSFFRVGEPEYTRGGKPITCEKCQGTGFFGRTGVFETVLISDETRAGMLKAKTMQEIGSMFRRDGMLLMQEQAIRKVCQGEIAVNEMVRELKSGKPSK